MKRLIYWKREILNLFTTYQIVDEKVVTSESPFFNDIVNMIRNSNFSYRVEETVIKIIEKRD